MTSNRTFYRTVVFIEVFGEKPYEYSGLEDLVHDIKHGKYVGQINDYPAQPLTAVDFVDMVEDQSSLDFFGLRINEDRTDVLDSDEKEK